MQSQQYKDGALNSSDVVGLRPLMSFSSLSSWRRAPKHQTASVPRARDMLDLALRWEPVSGLEFVVPGSTASW